MLAERVGPQGRVLGVDLEAVEPLGPPVATLRGDFTDPALRAAIADALGSPADLLLCDAAPKLSGISDVDRAAMQEIHEAALALAQKLLAPGGGLVLKAFPGPETAPIRKELERRFQRVSEVRPEAKRSSSKEFYWVAGPEPPRRRKRSRRRRRSGQS